MLQYVINNRMKRSGRMEMVQMIKYIVSPEELAGIDRFLVKLDDDVVHGVRTAIKRTNSLAFILFKPDAAWLQENCLNKLFKY